MNFSQFFSNIQEANWYQDFLSPLVNEIEDGSRVLDLGTGSGKLLEMLYQQKNVEAIGVDTNQAMLDEAKKKLKGLDIELQKIEVGEALPFDTSTFDYITICNVLFNLKPEAVAHILDEAKRLLKKGGKIIVLSPTGKGNMLKLTRDFISYNNRSIYVWYLATKKNGKHWLGKSYLPDYAEENNFSYAHKIILKGFAQVEVLIKD